MMNTLSQAQFDRLPIQVTSALKMRENSLSDIAAMSPKEIFNEYLEWNGIIHWTEQIWEAASILHEIQCELDFARAPDRKDILERQYNAHVLAPTEIYQVTNVVTEGNIQFDPEDLLMPNEICRTLEGAQQSCVDYLKTYWGCLDIALEWMHRFDGDHDEPVEYWECKLDDWTFRIFKTVIK